MSRFLLKNKVYTSINILGLSLGLTCCLLIFLMIKFELGFDLFHSKSDRIYRVITKDTFSDGVAVTEGTPLPLAEAVKLDIADIESISRAFYQTSQLIKVDNQNYKVTGTLYTDPGFFKVFDFKLIEGDTETSLASPNTVVISEKLAKRLFKNQPVMGKVVTIDNKKAMTITGVLKNIPANSHIQAEMLISFDSFEGILAKDELKEWGFLYSQSFLYTLLAPNTSRSSIEKDFRRIEEKYLPQKQNNKRTFRLQPLSQIHFDSETSNSDLPETFDKKYIWIFSSIGFFILLIACVNFINLASVQSLKRSREVGVRKVIGASRQQLTFQFLTETFTIVFISVVTAVLLAHLLLPVLNHLLEKNIPFSLLRDRSTVFFLCSILVIVTMLSGLYPSLVLSGYRPIVALKSKINFSTASLIVRRGLVVLQFSISIFFIIGTIIISNQLSYFRNRELGFDKDAIVTFEVPDSTKRESFRQKLVSSSFIKNISYAMGPPTSDSNFDSEVGEKGKKSRLIKEVNIKPADMNYLETFGLQVVAGRKLTVDDERHGLQRFERSDIVPNVLINEKLCKLLGYKNPEEVLGKRLDPGFANEAVVVGVVKDFHTASLHQKMQPLIIVTFPSLYFSGSIKIESGNVKASLASIEHIWKETFPDYPFDYKFLDDELNQLYKSEERLDRIFKIFSAIAIFIGCLGLFGLSSFIVVQRTKEIGVRKVLGASISGITLLLSKDLLKPVFISNLIAWPVAYFCMKHWLEDFAYKINIEPWIFVTAALIAVMTAFATVSFQAVKAAVANPIKSLKSE